MLKSVRVGLKSLVLAKNSRFCANLWQIPQIATVNIRTKVFLIAITLLNSSASSWKSDFGVDTVVIDAGHGGKDPGTHGVSLKEKDVALKIALKVGKYIEKNIPGVKVIYTRKDDRYIALDERAAIANRNKADLFICIHANAVSKSEIYGTETYVMG
ncbi:MAG: N-acetylmuramoyl-L-alanine amidase, partial [Cyclobacteriaceae bacterium]|nr:N-acetylmuramoyl-L-alanine amidase [Cyclobacteriaceae bacterium]